MTREDALTVAIAALTDVKVICSEYDDIDTARIAYECQKQLCQRLHHLQRCAQKQ